MRPIRRRATAVLALAGLTLGGAANAQPPGSAEVILARAPADAITRGQTTPRPLVKGARLAVGDRVRTGRGGAAEIRLGDGSLVRVGELSDFEVDRLDVDAAGAPTTSRFNLAAGQARAWVARQVIAKVAATEGGFAVQTPTAVAAVRQTDFALLHDAAAVTRVYTFAGAVETSAIGAASVTCARNRWTRVDPRRDPMPCEIIPLRDKRAVLKELAFQAVAVEPGDLDRAALNALGAKLSDERVTGGRLFETGPGRQGRSDPASHEAAVGTTVNPD
ncbi:MAG TPA: FecR family protein [Methylomirabilota bacterium]|jgi:hypothetical protein|nr:FecR family protein [Methylomirabilota bacterium]